MKKRMLAVLVGAVGVTAVLPGTPASSTTTGRIPGLDRPAQTSRDIYGVNHIRARSDRDLYFLQGYLHAQDRLFQMDLSRRQASGTQAELLGPEVVGDDVQLRTIGLRRAAERSLPVLSDEARAAVEAYAEGVNAWVDANPLPSDYAEVEVATFDPWTAIDSVVIGKLIAFGLSFDLDVDDTLDLLAYRGVTAEGVDGGQLFADTHPSAPFDPASTVPDATGSAPALSPGDVATAPDAPVPAQRSRGAASVAEGGTASPPLPQGAQAMAELSQRYLDAVDDIPLFSEVLDDERANGSNEWGITGAASESGRPLMANDPHLSLDMPSTFYPIHLASPTQNVIGSGFAGIPSVVLGHNQRVSWGATTNPLDVTDAYLEELVEDPASPSGLSTVFEGVNEPVVAIPETFRVNRRGDGTTDDLAVLTAAEGVPSSTLVVPRRNNGPIVQQLGPQALSIQYTGFSPTRELDTFLTWNKARGIEDFRRGLETFDVGSQNWAYSDTAGNLAYFTSAEMPLREDLEAGTVDGLTPNFIRDGTGGNEWLPATDPQPGQALPYEILPMDEMPSVVNPPAGFFVNANNDPAGTTLDGDPFNSIRPTGGIYYLNAGYDGLRGGRITERIRAGLADGGTISFAEMQDIQADVTLLDAEVFVPYVIAAYDAAAAGASVGGSTELGALAADPRVVEAIDRLRAWDFTTPTGIAAGYDASDLNGVRSPPGQAEIDASIAATIYSVWRGQAVQSIVDRPLADLGLNTPGSQQALTVLRRLLDDFEGAGGVAPSGLDFFAVPGVEDAGARRDTLLLRSVTSALDLLASDAFAPAFEGSTMQDSYRWGRLHRFTLDHPLGGERSVPSAGGAFPAPLPDLEGIPTDGGLGTVDASSHNARADAFDEFTFGGGPVRRYVSEAPRYGIVAESSLPGGVSGVLGSPFYVNLLPEWLTNESYPQLRRYREVLDSAYEVTFFRP